MSSLTTISSGMEESPEVEEIVDTTLSLSLSLVVGNGSRPPPAVQALLQASPAPQNEAVAVAGVKIKGPETATTRQHGKKARTVHGSSNVDNDDVDDVDQGGAWKKLRLTSEQAALMEKSFRAHNVLSHVRYISISSSCAKLILSNLYVRLVLYACNLHASDSDRNVFNRRARRTIWRGSSV
jgi:hypothetical protein